MFDPSDDSKKPTGPEEPQKSPAPGPGQKAPSFDPASAAAALAQAESEFLEDIEFAASAMGPEVKDRRAARKGLDAGADSDFDLPAPILSLDDLNEEENL